MNKIFYVMAVTLVTWGGIFGYLLYIDRSIRGLERQEREQDEL